MTASSVGAVVIGRNEGERLVRCLESVNCEIMRSVYVDSGSHDDSIAVAQAAGVEVVQLDTGTPFTAARARNEGLARILQSGPLDYIQFIDGDCELQPGWIETATAYLDAQLDVAVVCGRRRERYPKATIWNRLIDMEWDTPLGEARACGGDSTMRVSALKEVEGFNPRLIAGEEPELCVRLRKAGWRVVRLDAEMTLHDAAMTKFSQWWRRSRRAGHAFAEGAAMHGAPPERHYVKETFRALAWGFVLPLLTLFGMIAVSPWMAVVLVLWPLQTLRLVMKGRASIEAVFLTIGKIPEAIGALSYWGRQLTRHEARLIEYK